jgi:phosphate transport system substrate-binding protein
VGGVVPVVNIPGVAPGELQLDLPLLADIYRGTVTHWSDPAIAALNPELTLPDERILAIHREDPSGTTWVFTRGLAAASPAWAQAQGHGATVTWPAGIGATSNQQVLDFVGQFERTIAYVELTHALNGGLSWTALRGSDGRRLIPGLEGFAAAAQGQLGPQAENFLFPSELAGGEQAWPFTGASYALLRRDQSDPDRSRALLDFFAWTHQGGRESAEILSYLPLPEHLVHPLRVSLAEAIRVDGEPVWAAPAQLPLPGEEAEESQPPAAAPEAGEPAVERAPEPPNPPQVEP